MAPKGSQRIVKKVVAENRKARFNYEIIDTYEAGLVLKGTEVKSRREGKANIAESYASDEKGEEARTKELEKIREERRQKLEADYAKRGEPAKPLPEFGSTEDFPLRQALNQLQGKPVAVSKVAQERKAEAKTE